MRRAREDEPGAWHHVMNRGLARRTVFEGRADMRRFLAELARAVRAGTIEIHAFVLLSTHFHLLVRSPSGGLGETMRKVQNAYVRWFNRGRRRDGPLFRGRYLSRRVEDDEYRFAVVRYIDRNPVEAGLTARCELYPWCSAHLRSRGRTPPWLERSWVDSEVRRLLRRRECDFGDYVAVFHGLSTADVSEWVEKRLLSRSRDEAGADSILALAPPEVIDWMRSKARLGDGTDIGSPICDPRQVSEAVETAQARLGPWTLRGSTGPAVDGWRNARIVLLRLLCGASLRSIGAHCAISKSTAAAAIAKHESRIDDDPAYGTRMSELIRSSLAGTLYGVR
jgi:REP element-mobilizing transposase RayT